MSKLSILTQVQLQTMIIKHLIGGNIATLLVYSTPHSLYQYQILFKDGSLFQPQELYSSSSVALEAGLERINLVNRYQPSDND